MHLSHKLVESVKYVIALKRKVKDQSNILFSFYLTPIINGSICGIHVKILKSQCSLCKYSFRPTPSPLPFLHSPDI